MLFEKLQDFARKENIIAGVGKSEDFIELRESLKGKKVPFIDYDIDFRTRPSLTMENVKSIVAIGLSYNVKYKFIKDGKVRGNLSSGAIGLDYHILIEQKLKKLKDELFKESECKIFCDTGPLSDRDVAIRCDLGVRGKNGSVINKDIGGMFFIGYMLTDIEYEKWQVKKREHIRCGSCSLCLDYCPSKAISLKGCEYEKCISYITQEKGVLSKEKASLISKQIYGCDICQRVCPFNKGFKFEENELAYPDLIELLKMTNKEFKNVYGNTACGWRGKRTLQRNALIAIGNMKRRDCLEVLETFSKSEFEDLKSASIYAIKKIRGD